MKVLAIFACILLTAPTWAAPADDDDLVTKKEAAQALGKLEAVMAKRLSVKIPKSSLTGDQPASRAEIISEFMRILGAIKPSFRFTPRPHKIYDEPLAKANTGKTLTDIKVLIRLGMAGPVGPLATGGKGLTLEEFGDAMGLFFAQSASYTHKPSVKWTPNLQWPD